MISIGGVLGGIILTKSLQMVDATPVGLISTLEVLMAVVYQFALFNDTMPLHSAIGGGIVCIWVLITRDQGSNNL